MKWCKNDNSYLLSPILGDGKAWISFHWHPGSGSAKKTNAYPKHCKKLFLFGSKPCCLGTSWSTSSCQLASLSAARSTSSKRWWKMGAWRHATPLWPSLASSSLICSTPSHVGRNVRTCILAVSCVSVHKYILGSLFWSNFTTPYHSPSRISFWSLLPFFLSCRLFYVTYLSPSRAWVVVFSRIL